MAGIFFLVCAKKPLGLGKDGGWVFGITMFCVCVCGQVCVWIMLYGNHDNVNFQLF